jgi:hypothetical protein
LLFFNFDALSRIASNSMERAGLAPKGTDMGQDKKGTPPGATPEASDVGDVREILADLDLVVTHLAGVVGAALKQVGMRVELASDVRMALGRIRKRIDDRG